MSELPLWQKTSAERTTAIAQAFSGQTPAERTGPTLIQQLRAIGTLLAKKREEGFTVDQICASLKHPAVGIDASPVSIRRILAEVEKRRAQRRKARAAALLAGAGRALPAGNGASPRTPAA